MDERITYKNKKGKVFLYLLGSLLPVAAGAFIVLSETGLFVVLVGYLSIIFFGFGALLFTKFLFNKKPVLILDKYCIIDRSSWISVGKIEWNQIRDFVIYEQVISKRNHIKYISIDLLNIDELLINMNPLKRTLINMGMKFAPYKINISTQLMNVELNQVFEQMKIFHKNAINDIEL